MTAAPAIFALLALAAAPQEHPRDPEGPEALFDTKKKEPFLAKAPWILDRDAALAEAKHRGAPILAYFTRSYAPSGPCKALEDGLLSDPAFREWSKEVVLFCHVTTRIPGRARDGLLAEIGGTGFPTIAFLDGEGRLLARHGGDRTVAALARTAAAARAVLALRARAEAGEAGAAADLLEREAELGAIAPAEILSRARALAGLPEDAAKRIAELAFAAEVEELAASARTGPAERNAGAEQVLRWHAAGRVPVRAGAFDAFWAIVIDQGRATRNPNLLRVALGAMRERYEKDPQQSPRLAAIERQIQELEKTSSLDALREKAEGGDVDAKVRLLITLAELRSIRHADAVARAKALPNLPDATRRSVDDALFELEIYELSRSSRDREGALAAYQKVRGWVAEKRLPATDEGYRLFWSIVLNYAMVAGSEEALQFVADHAGDLSTRNPILQHVFAAARRRVDDMRAQSSPAQSSPERSSPARNSPAQSRPASAPAR